MGMSLLGHRGRETIEAAKQQALLTLPSVKAGKERLQSEFSAALLLKNLTAAQEKLQAAETLPAMFGLTAARLTVVPKPIDLEYALLSKDPEFLRMVLKANPKLIKTSSLEGGIGPLHALAMYEPGERGPQISNELREKMAETLLEAGSDINLAVRWNGMYGVTPLKMAELHSNARFQLFLEERGGQLTRPSPFNNLMNKIAADID
jgi:hypothetical protein